MKIQPLKNFSYGKVHNRFEEKPKPVDKPVVVVCRNNGSPKPTKLNRYI